MPNHALPFVPRPRAWRRLIAVLGLSGLLVGVAIAPDGETAYVGVNGWPSAIIDVIDVDTRERTAQIPIAGYDVNSVTVAPNGENVYVGTQAGVTVISTATKTVVDTIDTGWTYSVAVSPDGSVAYVTNYSGNSISVIDIATGAPHATTPTIAVGTSPAAVVFSPDGSTALVANEGAGTISVIDVATHRVNATNPTIAVGDVPNAVAYSPNEESAFVTVRNALQVSIIDTGVVIRSAAAPAGALPAGLSLDPATGVISGAATATSSDLAATITASNKTASATASYTFTIAPGSFTATPTPAVEGTLQVGSTLTATTPAWTPTTDAVGYQWLRDGVAIESATTVSYVLVAADAATQISVAATGNKSGYTSVTVTSAASVAVEPAAVVPTPVVPNPVVPNPVVPLNTTTAQTLELGDSASLRVSGTGFTMGETVQVWFYSTPVLLGSLTADAAGSVFGTFALPAGAAPGAHHVVLRGDTSGNLFSSEISVVAAQLSTTGVNAADIAWSALLLLLAGLALVQLRRTGLRRLR